MPTPKVGDAAAFARIARELLAEPSTEATFERVVNLAVGTVPGCDYASISLRRGKGRVETPASSDPIVEQADKFQYDLGEGPCLEAIWNQDTYVIEDMASEQRWPRWAPRAAGLGLGASLSVRLATEADVIGGLNLYASRSHVFDEDAVNTAHIYAIHASSALAASRQTETLRTGMQTRHMIGVAQGMLMLRYGLDEGQAFRFLARISQGRNVKLREIAADIIQELRQHPWPV